MATGRWVRLELLGERTGVWAGEIWQTGISMVDGSAGGVFPGAIREGLPSFTVNSDGLTEDTGPWDVYWAWKGADKFTKVDQLDLADAALAFWQGLRGRASTDSRLTGVRISAYDANRKVLFGSNYFYLDSPVSGSGGATTQLPPQLAIVMTTRTGARGAGGRGRMYLPQNTAATSNGHLAVTVPETIAAGGKAFLEAIHAIGPVPAVVNASKLTYSSINGVSVGNLFDVQRRRRNAFDETYADASLSYA